ncbi:hybrid sensor histidine kinase/response regulator [Duganella callida]|nr:ATP-binding protein [Duganella callida]
MSYIAPGAGNPARGESDSEKRYRALIRATADLVYRMNPDWTRMWQLDGKGFLGDAADAHHFWLDEYIPAEERERVHQAIAAAIRNKRVFELEHGVRLRDGTLGRVFSRAVPMLDADGEIYEWIGAASDVTVRQAAERKYRTLFNSIDEGFCIIDVPFDAHGRPYDYRFCEVNPSFETHSGLRDAAGKTIRELNPAHEQHWFSIYGDVQRTGQAVRFEHGSDSLERYFDVYAFRLEDGGQPKVAVLFKDISEAKRVTRQVRESEERAIAAARRAEQARRHLEALLQAAPVGIVMSDRNGGVVLTNAEHNRLWGGRPPQPGSVAEFAEWTGWWADESVRHGQRLEAEDWPTARALRGEFVRGATVQIASFGQPPVHHTLLLSGAPVYDEGNQVIGAVVVQMDITDRVKAEAALREADRKKDEFLAMLAHELRNPLAPISAAADLLAMARIDAGMIRRTSAIISRQVRHMAGLVDDLLDVSRVTRGLVNLKVEQLDLKQIVGEAMEQVRPLLESRRHNTILRTSPEPAAVSGDRTRLVQVLTNLLTNAAKYTPEGGHITVTTEVRDDAVQVHVVDNGIGIAPELIPHVFELFTQAQRTSDRSQGGLGIGLALVKRLIELQGGQVTAHSGGLGRGSRFTISLPHPRDAGGAAAQPPQPSPCTSASLKILIVDDNHDAAQMLAMYLEALGHTVSVEHSAHAALARAAAERPQVCLLDIGLPEMDGNQLARRLSQQPQTQDAVLVAISGYGQEHDRAAARDAGFRQYFVKPVDVDQLSAFLAQVALRQTG